jgi:DNA-binding transcriptional LysR family regulator
MTNIPTDLLRTLVAVVDLRSFTKAAASLGVTQPAVSAQIKRLQFLLGADLFDRSAQGVSLTAQGEVVVSYARRLLSINDQIVDLGSAELRPDVVIRVGTPSDFVASALPGTLARFRARWPDVRFIVRTDYFDQLVRDLRASEIDILVALSLSEPVEARHWRQQEVVWVRGDSAPSDIKGPVPLVSYGEQSVYHRVAVQALRSAGLDWQDVFTGPSLTSLQTAVSAGLGVMAVTRRRAEALGLPVWEDAPLPKLRDLFCGIYVRESGARSAYEQLADDIAKSLLPASERVTGSARLGGHRRASSAA